MSDLFSLCDNDININFLPKFMNWSPDGNSLIVSSFSNTTTILNNLEIKNDEQEHHTKISFLNNIDIKFPTTATNCCWYPLMNIDDQSSCCFACVMPFQPIKLIDSNTGRVRSMYNCQYHNYPASLTSVVFNGSSLLSGGTRTLYECPIQKSYLPGKPVIECPGSIMSIVPHQVSAYIALGINTGDIVFIDSRNYQVIFSEKFHNHSVDHIVWANSSSSTDLVFTSARLENDVIGIDTRNPSIPFTVVETKRNSSRSVSLSYANTDNKHILFVGNEESEAQIFDINDNCELIGNIGQGPTPLVYYNNKKNMIALASGKFEIIENDYDYSDDEKNDDDADIISSSVSFEPILKCFGLYIAS